MHSEFSFLYEMHLLVVVPSVIRKSIAGITYPPLHPKFSKSQFSMSCGDNVSWIYPSECIQNLSESIPAVAKAQHDPQSY